MEGGRGPGDRFSNFAVPALLVTAESTWAALLISAQAGSGPEAVHTILAWPAPRSPAMLAIAWFRSVWPRARPRWQIVPVVTAGVCVGALMTAVVVAWAVGARWWPGPVLGGSRGGHLGGVAAGVGWAAAILAWGRGTWLATACSVVSPGGVVGGARRTAVFLAVFAGRSDHHGLTFLASTADAGWALLVFFPVAGTALALVRQRDLEEEVLSRPAEPPGLAWLLVLGVPMVAVAVAAVVAGFLLGAGAPAAGRVISGAARAVWDGIDAGARWIWSLRPRTGRTPPAPRHLTLPSRAPALPGAHRGGLHIPITIPSAVWAVLIALVLVVMAYVVIRDVLPLRRSTIRFAQQEAPDEERSSLFSWRHLLLQLRTSLARLARALSPRRRATAPALPLPATPLGERPLDGRDLPGVRAAYRSVLVAAHSAPSTNAGFAKPHRTSRLDSRPSSHARRYRPSVGSHLPTKRHATEPDPPRRTQSGPPHPAPRSVGASLADLGAPDSGWSRPPPGARDGLLTPSDPVQQGLATRLVVVVPALELLGGRVDVAQSALEAAADEDSVDPRCVIGDVSDCDRFGESVRCARGGPRPGSAGSARRPPGPLDGPSPTRPPRSSDDSGEACVATCKLGLDDRAVSEGPPAAHRRLFAHQAGELVHHRLSYADHDRGKAGREDRGMVEAVKRGVVEAGGHLVSGEREIFGYEEALDGE